MLREIRDGAVHVVKPKALQGAGDDQTLLADGISSESARISEL